MNPGHDVDRTVTSGGVPSLRSRLLVAVLRATKRKAPYVDVQVLHERIHEERRTIDATPPKDVRLDERFVAGIRVLTAQPGGASTATRRLLFFHGGCYVFEIVPEHYRFCAALAQALGAAISIPIYPLAPENSAAFIQEKMRAVVDALGPFDAWLGDSAGAGLALALAQQNPHPPPLVLLSPWLDIALENPAIGPIDERDPWLSRVGLRECGRLYAKELDSKDPRVSPIHGRLDHIPRISMFIGTRDIFLPDARKLRDRAPEKIALFEYPEMVHEFMLIRFLPEARRAFRDIVNDLSDRRAASGKE
jgi:acetyl esterase/lipase